MSSVCVPQDAEALSHCGPPSATCKKNIDWMRSDGLVNHPDWYPGSGLTPASPAAAMQAWLYHRGGEDCSLPCGDLSALHLGFDPVRPSWLAPDVDSDPHTICNERVLWQPERPTSKGYRATELFATGCSIFAQLEVSKKKADGGQACLDGVSTGKKKRIRKRR